MKLKSSLKLEIVASKHFVMEINKYTLSVILYIRLGKDLVHRLETVVIITQIRRVNFWFFFFRQKYRLP